MDMSSLALNPPKINWCPCNCCKPLGWCFWCWDQRQWKSPSAWESLQLWRQKTHPISHHFWWFNPHPCWLNPPFLLLKHLKPSWHSAPSRPSRPPKRSHREVGNRRSKTSMSLRLQETAKLQNRCLTKGADFFVLFFSVWGTFPCYLLHVRAKTCTLLNFGAKICHLHCSSIFPWFCSIFPWCSLICRKSSSIFP